MASHFKRSYDDFEPFCQWQRGQGRDVLEVHLQGYSKEQMRVQINNRGDLIITGERPINDTKISRFRKEIKVPTELTADRIRAKFANGILYITLQYEKPQAKESEEVSNKKSTNNGNNNNNNSNKSNEKIQQRDGILRIDLTKKMAVSVGVVVALGIVMGGFLISWKCSKVPAPPLIH